MANTFKTVTDTAVGTSAATIYTCPASTETTVIGMNVANILSTGITVDIQFVNDDGDNVYIVKDAPVPVGGALVAVGGDQKIVVNEDDSITVTASQASAADVTLSVLEIT
jgi:hypothetical protein